MLRRDQHPANSEWVDRLTSTMPGRWRKRLKNQWGRQRYDFNPHELGAEGDATRRAAYWLQDTIELLQSVNLPLDAKDGDIVARAEERSEHCNSLAMVFHDRASLRAAMELVLRSNHIEPLQGEADWLERHGTVCALPEVRDRTDTWCIKRYVSAKWWRLRLRRLHAKAVEGAAIRLGYVNLSGDCYVSNESLYRRKDQIRRNNEVLEATKIRNELDQEFTLAEVIARSVSNKAIRRGELMTRIAGFEVIAKDMNHIGLFITITCPSRMHRYRMVNNKGGKFAVENSKYDGTNPKEAQAYLAHVWQLIRSRFDRKGVGVYGFRIAEPNHDGTPHWHLLLFFSPEFREEVEATVWRYALRDSPGEKGAREHRADIKLIDFENGGAAGYIAKYVSKNIDAYKVEKDLFGNDCVTASQRVEAWASTWRIRQFQQIGGPPVGVWRELRRVEREKMPADAPAHLIQAFEACNRIQLTEDGVKPAEWAEYVRAQGGVFCGRSYRVRVKMEEQDGVGEYGDPLGMRPIGVETDGVAVVRDGICVYEKAKTWSVPSARHRWEVIRQRSRALPGDEEEGAGAVVNGRPRREGAKRPRTRVNNCTAENLPWGRGIDFSVMSPVSTAENCRAEWDFSRKYDDDGRLKT